MVRLVVWTTRAAALAGAAMVVWAAITASPARGDTQSPALAKYANRVDHAIDRALAFLASQQRDDGSFKGMKAGETAITSLSVMAFLAKGYTPGCGPYGQVINKGIDYVIAQQDPKTGLLIRAPRAHGAMYHHGISTLMLAEVSGMVSPARQRRVDVALAKALKVILAAQQVQKPLRFQGGWRYQINSRDSDMSCTGWQLMALRAARNDGAPVPSEAIDRAIRFILNCRMPDGGFAYQPGGALGGGAGRTRTGTALLCLELCGHHNDQVTLDAAKWLRRHLPGRFGDRFFYYGMYYCSQAMFQVGGDDWVAWATRMYDMMLKYQNRDGSWPRGGDEEAHAGLCYSTAMGVLAISVAYRQLPIYQR